jgi:dynein heavy chain, axonemal
MSTAKSTVTGKKDFWQQSSAADLHKVLDVVSQLKRGYDMLSGDLYRYVTLDEAVIFSGYDQFMHRFGALAEIFDAWTRYDSFVHVEVKGVRDILEDFESHLMEFTDDYQRTDFLDDLNSGDSSSIFKIKLESFKSSLSNLDQRLWQALEEALEDDSVTVPRALRLMQKFESVSTLHVAEHIRYNIEKLYVKVLHRWLDELRDVQSEYESQKHDPPVPRNVPRALGGCLWAQQVKIHDDDPAAIEVDLNLM